MLKLIQIVTFFHLFSVYRQRNALEQKRIESYLCHKSEEEIAEKVNKLIKRRNQTNYRNKLATKLFDSQPDIEGAENECLERAIKDFATRWDEQQQKKRERIERLREERIRFECEAREREKQALKEELLERQLEKSICLKNEELNIALDHQQRLAKIQKAKELRSIISKQIASQNQHREDTIKRDRESTNRTINDEAQRDDANFFCYANNLLNTAQREGRPIYPLIKAIKQYKQQHSLIPKRDVLPHMKSKVDLSMR